MSCVTRGEAFQFCQTWSKAIIEVGHLPIAGLPEILGENFARGHAQASGGSVSADAFKRLLHTLGFDEHGNTLGGADKKRKQAAGDAHKATPGKKTKTLMSFGFKKEAPADKDKGAAAASQSP